MSEARILVVEDEPAQRELVCALLSDEGWRVDAAGSAEAALERLEGPVVDLVLSDWKLPGADGMWLLGEVRRARPEVGFVMVTAHGSIGHAMEAVRAGADDYLAKPFERAALVLAVERTLRARRLASENRRLTAELGDRDRLVDLIGRAPAMQQVYRLLEKVGPTDATVLVSGESGSGKELAARALHRLSGRSGRFVALNCAAIPEGLLEAECFGVVRGAYTGATAARPGAFQSADGGTLFLDEIGELPLALQPKLLRAIQERAVSPVGGDAPVAVDVRLVAATNRQLATEVAEGRFREDLYYRLDVLGVRMPPLRERREDVPLLVGHLVETAARRHGRATPAVSPGVMRRLLDHGWPGNVRELANVVERMVLLGGEVLGEAELPEGFGERVAAPAAMALPAEGLDWEAHERSLLRQALERAHGNRAAAARLLGLSYKAFLYRLEKHEIRVPEMGK